MAQTVGQHGVAAFTSPVNGDPLNATVVVANDNATRGAYVDHDSDPDIHVQSSLLASRPAAGTVGRKWLTTDSGAVKLWFDTGSAWSEIAYLPSAGGTVAGNVSVTGTLGVTGVLTATGGVVGAVTGNASTATALQTARAINGVNFDGTAAITVPAAAGTLTGATLASNVLASSLTSVGTLAGLTVTAPITGSVTGSSGSTTGNAATATALQTGRAINGVTFDGTAPITVTAAAGTLSGATLASGVTASSLTSVGTLTGLTVTNPIVGSVTGSSGSTTGNAATATALQTARTINGTSFDGTANVTVTAAAGTLTGTTLASGVTASSLTSVGTLGSLTVTNPITGSVTGSSGSTTGNAATATALQTSRNINGTAFNGTADITVTAAAGTLTGSTLASGVTASSLTSVGTLGSLAVSGVTTLSAGTAALPALTTTGDTNTGLLFPAADTIALSTGGTERARIDSSGNLGLGVTPSAWNSSYKAIDVGNSLALIGSASAADLYFNAYIDSGSTFRYRQTATASAYSLALGQHRWYTAPSGTAGAAISLTQVMTLDASGNLGLGVTPSAWTNSYKGIELSGAALTSNDTTSTFYLQNAYVNGGQFLYKASAFASAYGQSTGVHAWYRAPSGTAGNAISFTQDMTLASGKLTVNAGAGAYAFQATGTNTYIDVTDTGLATVRVQSSGNVGLVGTTGAHPLSLATNNVQRWRVDGTGNFVAFVDATYDIGASGATRPRSLYLSSSAVISTGAARLTVGSADGVVGGIYGNATGEIVMAADALRIFNKAVGVERMQVDNTTTAGQTALRLWDVDNGTLERVTVGAADSGGVGFKVLRIPN